MFISLFIFYHIKIFLQNVTEENQNLYNANDTYIERGIAMHNTKRLSKAEMHKKYIVKYVFGDVGERIRLFDLGFSPDSCVTPLYKGICGGTTAFLVKGTLIAIRQEECEKIFVSELFRGDET